MSDVNDNAPVCPELADLQVDRDVEVGHLVVSLLLSDADEGKNSEVTFLSVAEGFQNEELLFTVDGVTGDVTTIRLVLHRAPLCGHDSQKSTLQ